MVAAFRGNDPHRHSLSDSKGITHGKYNISDPEFFTVRERDDRQIVGVDLDHCHIRLGVGADNLGREFPVIGQ